MEFHTSLVFIFMLHVTSVCSEFACRLCPVHLDDFTLTTFLTVSVLNGSCFVFTA